MEKKKQTKKKITKNNKDNNLEKKKVEKTKKDKTINKNIKSTNNIIKENKKVIDVKKTKKINIKVIIAISLLVVAIILCIFSIINKKHKNKNKMAVSSTTFNKNDKELFKELKAKFGLDYILAEADKNFLTKEIKNSNEEKEYIKNQITKIEESYQNTYRFVYKTFEEFLNVQYNVKSRTELEDIIGINYKLTKYTEVFAEKDITEKEIKDYYNKNTSGEMKASHILIQTDVKASASEEEKNKAKNKAYKEAEDIIKKLDKGEKFADLAKKYSKDTTAKKGGDLGYFKKESMTEAFANATLKLKVNEYTKKPVETEYGYHIILKTGEKEKPKLKEVKNEIKKKLAKEKTRSDAKIYEKARLNLRNKYKFKINDKLLAKKYKNYLKNINL